MSLKKTDFAELLFQTSKNRLMLAGPELHTHDSGHDYMQLQTHQSIHSESNTDPTHTYMHTPSNTHTQTYTHTFSCTFMHK